MDSKKDHVLLYLSKLKCPVDSIKSFRDKETRFLVLEFLLKSVDQEFFAQCELEEGSSRSSRIAKQLFVLGLGGSKMSSIESSFVDSPVDEKSVINVVLELCRLIAYSKEVEENVEENLKRDLEFPKTAAKKSKIYFSEEMILFPKSLLEKAGKSKEKIDTDFLVEDLKSMLDKLNKAIEAFDVKKEEKLSKALAQNPDFIPLLTKEFQMFDETISLFNDVYEREISHWNVESTKPNAELGTLIVNVNQKHREWKQVFEAFQKSSWSCREIERVEKELEATLQTKSKHGPQLNEHYVEASSKSGSRLENL